MKKSTDIAGPTFDISSVSEQQLRLIWQRQLFVTSRLFTQDGKPLSVLYPGRPNHDGGPDFIDALVQIGGTTYRGDVELHRTAAGWNRHTHGSDQHYNRVVLHVVLHSGIPTPESRTQSKRSVPLLVLASYLSTTPDALLHSSSSLSNAPRNLACKEFNASLPSSIILQWLTSLARRRIDQKIKRLEARLNQLHEERGLELRERDSSYAGNPDEIPVPHRLCTPADFMHPADWEQLLYEGIVEGLGYAKNREPFLRLARSIRLQTLQRAGPNTTQVMMAILFGAAGLLPTARQLPTRDARSYVRSLRKRWKKWIPNLGREAFCEGDWLFLRLRPENFPTARLAALCFLLPTLFAPGSLERIIDLFATGRKNPRKTLGALRALFRFTPDTFWSRHLHFRSREGRVGISLGRSRVHELLVNSLLPVVLLHARLFRCRRLRAHAWSVMTAVPPSQENAITRTVSQQLLREKLELSSSFLQQGALQLYTQYCLQERCRECRIGRLISLHRGGGGSP